MGNASDRPDTVGFERVQTRLTKPLAEHVSRVTGPNGLYSTPSHYLQDLIRRDMERDVYKLHGQIVDGFKDIAAGRMIESSGDLDIDLAELEKREADGWS
jgi:antitoxin ParD1/3/4